VTAASRIVIEVAGKVGSFALEASIDAREGPLVVVGPNGAGKSTLLAMVLGLVRPARGRIALAGEPLFDAERGIDVPVERREIGWVPQGTALFPHLDVRGNVAFAAQSAGEGRDEAAARVEAILQTFELEALASRRCATASLGAPLRCIAARCCRRRCAPI
jgi:molybdate transport system ATP-binding protein